MIQDAKVFKLATDLQTLTSISGGEFYAYEHNVSTVFLYAPLPTNDSVYVKFITEKFFNLQNVNQFTPKYAPLRDTLISQIVPEEDIEDGYHLWGYVVKQDVTGSNNSQSDLPVRISFQQKSTEDSDNLIDYYITNSVNVETIKTELETIYNSSNELVEGNYINVFKRTSNEYLSYVFNGTSFDNPVDVLNEVYVRETGYATKQIKASGTSGVPIVERDVTDEIVDELSEINSQLQIALSDLNNKIDEDVADSRYYHRDGSRNLTGNMDANFNAINSLQEISIRDESGNTTEFARIFYQHTDGNNYQVVRIQYPDGRIEEINEVHEYNFRNETGITIDSGVVLMTDGTTQGGQSVRGFLFDENSPNSMNLVGVATVDGITTNTRSKATYLGIVSGVSVTTLFNSGTPYAEGQVVYARQGKLSNVAPNSPSRIVRMGAIINQSGSTYDIVIAPLIFQKFTELSDSDFVHNDGHIPISDGTKLLNVDLTARNDAQFSEVFKDVAIDPSTYVLTFTQWDDSVKTIDLPLESAIVSIEYDSENKDLIFTLRNGTQTVVPLDDIITGLATETYVLNAISTALLNYYNKDEITTLLANKVSKDFSPLENKLSLVNNDTFVINDSLQSGNLKEVSFEVIKNQIIVDGEVFDNTSDYSQTGLGAFDSASVKIHNLTLNIGAQVYTDIKTVEQDRIYHFRLPTISSTNTLQISVDNQLNYYNVQFGGQNVQGTLVSGNQIDVYWDGTNWQLYEMDVVENTHPYVGNGAHNLPKNGIEAAITKESLSPYGEVKGRMIEQLLSNGRFDTDISDWSQFNGTALSWDSGTESAKLTFAVGVNTPRYYQSFNAISGQSYYISCDMLINDTNIYSAHYLTIGSEITGGVIDFQSFNDLSTSFQSYSAILTATASGTWYIKPSIDLNGTQVVTDYALLDNVRLIPLPSDITTIAQAEALLDGAVLSKGLHSVGEPRTYVASDYDTEMQEYIERDGKVDGDTIEGVYFRTLGKNKFDETKNILYQVYNSSNTLSSDNRYLTNEIISALPSTSYTVSDNKGDFRWFIMEYDSSMNFIIAKGFAVGTYTFTTSSNTKHIVIQGRKNDGTDMTETYANEITIQLELGTNATEYEPYKSQLSHVQGTLRRLSSTVYDTLTSQVIEVETGVSGTAVVNATLLPLIDLSGIFIAEDETTGETQYGVYGDTLALSNPCTVYYQLATPITREIIVDGQQLVSPTSTYEQFSPVLSEFDVQSAISLQGQMNINVKSDIEQQKDIQALEENVYGYHTHIEASPIMAGASNPAFIPDYDYTEGMFLFPRNSTTEVALGTYFIKDERVPDTPIYLRVHAYQEFDLQAVMKIDYKVFSLDGGTVPTSYTTGYTCGTWENDYTSGKVSNTLISSTPIDTTGLTGRLVIKYRVYRDDNVYTGDLSVDEIGVQYVRYNVDTEGS